MGPTLLNSHKDAGISFFSGITTYNVFVHMLASACFWVVLFSKPFEISLKACVPA